MAPADVAEDRPRRRRHDERGCYRRGAHSLNHSDKTLGPSSQVPVVSCNRAAGSRGMPCRLPVVCRRQSASGAAPKGPACMTKSRTHAWGHGTLASHGPGRLLRHGAVPRRRAPCACLDAARPACHLQADVDVWKWRRFGSSCQPCVCQHPAAVTPAERRRATGPATSPSV